MEPTKLPTDNLYKFIALAGVAIFLFGCWVWNENTERQLKARIELTKLGSEAEKKRLVEDSLVGVGQDVSYIKVLRKIRKQIKEDKEFRESISKGTAFEGEILDEGSPLTEEDAMRIVEGINIRRGVSVGFELSSIDATKELRRDAEMQPFKSPLVLILGPLGIIVAAVGFWLWFTRTQKPEDEIKRAELAELKARQAPS